MLGTRYLVVLATAVLCYAALGAVLGILPDYVHSLGGEAVLVGVAVMAAGTIPAFVRSLPLLIASRLAVGAGEAMMMAATVLWLLRRAGPERRGRAMGHVGLANSTTPG